MPSLKLVLVVFLLIIVGCNDSKIVTPDEEQNNFLPIVPLNVGNYWNYRILDNNHDSISVAKYAITDKSKINGSTLYTQKELVNNTISYLSYKTNGLYQSENDFIAHLICKYPASDEETWSDSVYSINKQGKEYLKSVTKYKLDSKKGYASVPAGRFNCYTYAVIYSDYEKEEIISRLVMYYPGIGKVYESYQKILLRDPSYHEISSMELVSYKVE